jgi:NAD(P)-dependent dehydrogenase (short-subunit alcohol dehydrogenase family)
MKKVVGKVAFITAGASGIGWGMARAFMNAGMKVVVGDILQDHIEECRSQYPGNAALHFIKLDVSDRPQMERAAREVEERFGRLDVLCNNAGVAARGQVDDAGYADWDYVMGVCVGGTINGLVNFLPLIKKHGEGGHVVTTSSMAGMIPVPFNGLYATAKFAVRGMMDALRLSLGPHKIGVSVLCPGFVATRATTAGDRYRAEHDGKPLNEHRDPAKAGMDPLQVGERVITAILDNELYVFPHGEFREEVRAYFDRMLAAFPDDFNATADKGRLDIERGRMTRTEEARRIAAAIDGAEFGGPSVAATVDAWMRGRQP